MRGSSARWAGGAALTLAGCRLVACGGDDGGAGPDSALPDRDGAFDPDADTDTGDGSGPYEPPSFCNGIVFYASLDGAYGPDLGGTPGAPWGNAQLVGDGKFGGATSLLPDGGLGDGAAVYYDTPPDGGVPWFSNEVGTVSLWYRGTAFSEPPVPTNSPVLWRAVGSLPPGPVLGGGLTLVSVSSNQFGLVNTGNGGTIQNILVFPVTSIHPYVSDGEYNHFITAWQRGDAAPPPSAVMLVNGGSGKIFDAAIDAPSYTDAQPDDAGDLLVPYRAIRSRPWDSDASATAFRLGGTGQSASDGEIDDVVVWNRVLSLPEMEAVYAANAPVGDVCKLK